MEIHKSSEDYLEAILILSTKNGYVRNLDIADYMRFSKPSITYAITTLCHGGYVRRYTDKNIYLTDKGKVVAEKIYEKHEFFKDYLISIGVDENTATSDAYRIEYAISDISFEKLKQQLKDNCMPRK